ncbi:phosphoribosylformylglycinamidine synthase, partial [Candidatus Kaiserbacteria bacterium]|nr:phosphoribosylformylglycinamidine synthase [Candidatus Kaiserbacteria bacterium]
MTARIAVSSTIEDARAKKLLQTLKGLFPEARLTNVATAAVYTIDAALTAEQIRGSAERLTNPITEQFFIGDVLAPDGYAYAIEIGYLPGVKDNLGATVQETIEDTTGRKFRDGEAVYSSRFIFFTGDISKSEVKGFARELHNPLIERSKIFKAGEKFPIVIPKVELHESTKADEVDLNVSDAELIQISKEGILGPASAKASAGRRGPLALTLQEMKTIRDYFKKLKRNPTDVELESLAGTWSEHCKH